jgi:hypothetical protein
LCFVKPTEAQVEPGGDQAIEQEDLNADRDSETYVPFRIRSRPAAAAETQKNETD